MSSLYGDMNMTKVFFGQAATKGYGCITFQPIHDDVNDQGRIAVAVVGTLFVEPDTLSKLCRDEKMPHEAMFGEVIFRPILKRTGRNMAGNGLAGIATMHPDYIMETLDHTTLGEWPQPKAGK